MPTCPTCLTKYPDGVSSCTSDGAKLVPDETFAHIDRELEPGTSVGEYTIESKLGEGGFGTVYRAVHPLIGKAAAVKLLARQFSTNPTMVSRFIQEARAVNQIRHRNIIDIFSFGQLADGRQYYIMELLEGTSLDAYLRKQKRLSLEEAMPILRGVARALDAAHAKGIIHRDLKPENIYLLEGDEGRFEAKLLDFGLVKLLQDTSNHKTKTGTPMGTPYYMSPEQCRGLDTDARTDVYSFGALVFEILTGEVPFQGQTTLDILFQHMTVLAPSASERHSDVPPALDSPIAKMLAKDPADRPATVSEALDNLARAGGIEVPVIGPSSRPRQSGSSSSVPGRESERGLANTIVADPASLPSPRTTPVDSPSRAKHGGHTFLGAETDIAPQRRRGRQLLVGGVALAAVAVGAGLFVAFASPPPSHGTTTASSAPPPSTASAHASVAEPAPTQAPRTEVDLSVTDVPEGTAVFADGVELGPAPGPFKVKIGVPLKLTLSAKGYKTKELAVTPTENVLVPAQLERAAAVAPIGHRPTPSSTIHSDLEGFDKK